MKNRTITSWIVAGMLISGAALTAFAQNGAGKGNGKGYGAPPQSQQERADRQASCTQKDCGSCNNGACQGGQGQGQCQGNGKGQGKGKGMRHGACDGTGPRAGTSGCPMTQQ